MINPTFTRSAKVHKAASQWRVRVFHEDSRSPSADQIVWAVNQWSAVRFVTKARATFQRYGTIESGVLNYSVPADRKRKAFRVIVEPVSDELTPVTLSEVGYHGFAD